MTPIEASSILSTAMTLELAPRDGGGPAGLSQSTTQDGDGAGYVAQGSTTPSARVRAVGRRSSMRVVGLETDGRHVPVRALPQSEKEVRRGAPMHALRESGTRR